MNDRLSHITYYDYYLSRRFRDSKYSLDMDNFFYPKHKKNSKYRYQMQVHKI